MIQNSFGIKGKSRPVRAPNFLWGFPGLRPLLQSFLLPGLEQAAFSMLFLESATPLTQKVQRGERIFYISRSFVLLFLRKGSERVTNFDSGFLQIALGVDLWLSALAAFAAPAMCTVPFFVTNIVKNLWCRLSLSIENAACSSPGRRKLWKSDRRPGKHHKHCKKSMM